MTPIYDGLLKERVELATAQLQTERIHFLIDMDNNTRPPIQWPTPGAPYASAWGGK